MTQINLLPWREQLREERKQQFFVVLGASVGFVFFGGVYSTSWKVIISSFLGANHSLEGSGLFGGVYFKEGRI